MRVVYFGNSRVGLDVLRWLVDQPDELVGLVVHPAESAKFRDVIIAASGLAADRVFNAPDLRDSATVDRIANLNADIGFSSYFGYILRAKMIDLFPYGIVNLHPALLPSNRGSNPNIWSIVDGTAAGVTMHYIDEGIDTGDIIDQRIVDVEPVDTGESLYSKLESAAVQLAMGVWPGISSGESTRTPQTNEDMTEHRTGDVDSIDEIVLDKSYTGRELINILRARTFPPYRGAYFLHEGKNIYLRLQLLSESEIDTENE